MDFSLFKAKTGRPFGVAARFQAATFPFTARNVATFLFLLACIAVSLPTSAIVLIGPDRWTSMVFDSLGWRDSLESAAAAGVTLVLALITVSVALAIARVVLRTGYRHVRYGLPAGLLAAAAGATVLLANPAVMIQGLDEATTTTGNYTFGAFPSKERVKQLSEEGYTIVSLVHPSILPFEARLLEMERGWASEYQMDFVSIPLMPWMNQNVESIALLEQLAATGTGKYYVHCWFGYHRTMDARAIILAVIDPAQALAMPEGYGLHSGNLVLPDARLIVLVGPPMVIFLGLLGTAITWLHVNRRVSVHGTRKVFHVAVFSMAALLHVTFGTPSVLLFGAVCTAGVLYAVYRGKGFGFHDALRRPTDRKELVVVPVMATALGGIIVTVFFHDYAQVGFLVAGWGDAAGEVVGRAVGRVRYAVKHFSGAVSDRTVEGSLAVAVVAAVGAFVGLVWVGIDPAAAAWAAAVIGVTASLAEAVSGGGVDNLVLQLVGAGGAYLLV